MKKKIHHKITCKLDIAKSYQVSLQNLTKEGYPGSQNLQQYDWYSENIFSIEYPQD